MRISIDVGKSQVA